MKTVIIALAINCWLVGLVVLCDLLAAVQNMSSTVV